MGDTALLYGDIVLLTTQVDGQELVLQHLTHESAPSLLPLASTALLVRCCFQLQEHLLPGSRAAKILSPSSLQGKLVMPGGRLALFHLISGTYLNCSEDAGVEGHFGSRLCNMQTDLCVYLRPALRTSQTFNSQLTETDDIVLNAEDSQKFYHLCADTIPYFGSASSVWRLRLYDRIHNTSAFRVPYGIPFSLSNSFTGGYLAASKSGGSVQLIHKSELLSKLWMLAPAEDREAARLQSMCTGEYLTATGCLGSLQEDCSVQLSSSPLRIDQITTVRTSRGFLSACEAREVAEVIQSIFRRIPGVESAQETDFVETITKQELCQFEVVMLHADLSAVAFRLQGVGPALAAAASALEAQRVECAEQFQTLVECLLQWQLEARNAHCLQEFHQLVRDLGLNFEAARLATYASLQADLPCQRLSVQIRDSLLGREDWRMDEVRFLELLRLSPDFWCERLVKWVQKQDVSGVVALGLGAVLAPYCSSSLRSAGEAPVAAQTCMLEAFRGVHTCYDRWVLEHLPVLSLEGPLLRLDSRHFSLLTVKPVLALLDHYTHIVRNLVFERFSELRSQVLGTQTGLLRNKLDEVVFEALPAAPELISVCCCLNKLNVVLKYRSEFSRFSAKVATTVVLTMPDFVPQHKAALDVEREKWRLVQQLLPCQSPEVLDFAESCLTTFHYLVGHFHLDSVQITWVALQTLAFLQGFTRENAKLKVSWEESSWQQLRLLVSSCAESAAAKRAFERSLKLLKVCLNVHELFFLSDQSDKPNIMLAGISELLPNFVRDIKDYAFAQESLETISFLLGAIIHFDERVKQARPLLQAISCSEAQALCKALDEVGCLDLLAKCREGQSPSPSQLEEIKRGLRTLDELLTHNKNRQQVLAALGLTEELLLLVELCQYIKDGELQSLLLGLICKSCHQAPSIKARLRECLRKLDFSLEVPQFVSLLDEFGVLADLSSHSLQQLFTAITPQALRAGGVKLEALHRLVEVNHSTYPMFVISATLLNILPTTQEPEHRLELLRLLQKMAVLDAHLSRSLQASRIITEMRSELPSPNYFDQPTIKDTPEREDQWETPLIKTDPEGHVWTTGLLEQAQAIHLVLESFTTDSRPSLYSLGQRLFKQMEAFPERFSAASFRVVQDSGVHLALVHDLQFTRSLVQTAAVLRCLRSLLGVEETCKAQVLAALQDNKAYFQLLRHFKEVTRLYQAEVKRPHNPRFSLVRAYFKFFTAGCDLCTESFQSFVREQIPGSTTNTDLLQLALSLLSSLCFTFRQKAYSEHRQMICTLIDFLTEAVSGPHSANQRVVGSNQSLYVALNAVVKRLRPDQLKTAASLLSLLSALLEQEHSSEQSDICKAMAKTLDTAELCKFLVLIRKTKQAPLELRRIGVRLCIFLCDFKTKCKELVSTPSADAAEALHHFCKHVGAVEVQKDGEIFQVLFPLGDHPKLLTAFTQQQLLLTVQKQSLRQEKLDDLLSGLKTCAIEVEVQRSSPAWVRRWAPYWQVFSRLSFFTAVVINCLLLASVQGSHYHDRMHLQPGLTLLLFLLGLLQSLLYCAAIYLYWRSYYYTIYYPLVKVTGGQDVKELAFDPALNRFRSPYEVEAAGEGAEQTLQLQQSSLWFLFYHFLFLSVSIAALFWSPLYAVLLLGVVAQNERFITILQALGTNWQMLGITALLMCIVIYEFSVVAYLYFFHYYNSRVELECDDLFNCFVSTLNMGLRGGLADALAEIQEQDYWTRLAFDLTFQVLVMMLFLNVVFGIIIDAFGDLRDARCAIEEDMNNNCLVCGWDRSTIDLRGETWQQHLTQVHSYSNYLYFILYVRKKRLRHCSGLEKYVKDHISKNSVSFMPTSSAVLQRTEQAEDSGKYAELEAELTRLLTK